MYKKLTVFLIAVIVCVAFIATPDTAAAATKPSKVVVTSVTANSPSSVMIKWKKAKRAAKYQVYRSTNKATGYKRVKTTKQKYFANKGLKANTTYYFKVRAINGNKKGTFSKVKKVHTLVDYKLILTVDISEDGRTAYLSWTSTVPEGWEYDIFDLNYSETDVLASTTEKSIELSLKRNRTYRLEVNARGIHSNSVELTTPANPAFIDYNGVRLTQGEAWMSDLNESLGDGNPAPLMSRKTSGLETYCYDTEDYDEFLVVYVYKGKVYGWQTNMSFAGYDTESEPIYNGETQIRDNNRFTMAADKDGNAVLSGVFTQENSLYLSLFDTEDIAGECVYLEHLINAVRVAYGKQPLQHSDILYGDPDTYSASGILTSMEMTYEKYGHYPGTVFYAMDKGPCAGMDNAAKKLALCNMLGVNDVSFSEIIGILHLGYHHLAISSAESGIEELVGHEITTITAANMNKIAIAGAYSSNWPMWAILMTN